MADLRIVDAPLLSTVKGTEKLPTGGEGNFSVSIDQVADFAKLKWILATEGYVDNAVGNVQADLNLHKNNVSNPHSVTKAQVGLGNVDNTADVDKPVSHATQSAIITANSGKADKSYVDSQDQLKADKTTVETSLLLKADKVDLKASKIESDGGQTQQVINDFGGAKWYSKSGGYALGSTVKLANGDIVKSTIPNNTNDPNINMIGWKNQEYEQLLINNGLVPVRQNFVFVSDPLFGVTGDGSNETAKAQAALDYVGLNGTIYIPQDMTVFCPDGLQLQYGQRIIGFGRESSVIQGDGTNAVIKTNPTMDAGNVRSIGLLYVQIDNVTKVVSGGKAAVELYRAPDSLIYGCMLRSKNWEALDMRLSVRCTVQTNRIIQTGTAFAWCMLNNCNGLNGQGNVVSGGRDGSGFRIGRSQTMNLSNTVVEVAGGVAARIGGNDGADLGGNCLGINLSGLYTEQCKRVLEAGLQFECYGINLDGLWIEQSQTTIISAYEEPLHFGRASGVHFDSCRANGSNTTAFMRLYYGNTVTGNTPFLSNSRLISNGIEGYTGVFSFNDATALANSAQVMGKNLISINSISTIGSTKEYISPEMTCNVAQALKFIIPPSTYGGIILSVEIIDATGTLNGTLDMGHPAGVTATLTKDLSTVTLYAGYALLLSEADKKDYRATGLQMRLTAGAATTKFRVRVRYRG